MKIVLRLTLLATVLAAGFASERNIRRGLVDEEGVPKQSAREARAEDITLISRETGWSRADVESHMELQDSFKKLVAGLTDDSRFSDAIMAKEPGAKPQLLFKNGVPPGVEAKIAKFEAENGVKIERVSSKLSRKEKKDRLKRIQNKLKNKNFGEMVLAAIGDELKISANKPRNNDKIKPSPANHKVPPGQVDKVAAEILELDEDDDELQGLQLDIYDAKELAQTQFARGGRCLKYLGMCWCTSAFTVSDVRTGETGLLTADHCDEVTVYDAESPQSDFPIELEDGHYGYLGDVAWFKTPGQDDLPEYWASPTSKRDVTGVDYYPSVAEWVCVYSRVLETRTCTQIYANMVTSCPDGNCVDNLVAVTEPITVDGDSGGPWSLNTVAYGVHHGVAVLDSGLRSAYSELFWLRVALNVEILTT